MQGHDKFDTQIARKGIILATETYQGEEEVHGYSSRRVWEGISVGCLLSMEEKNCCVMGVPGRDGVRKFAYANTEFCANGEITTC